MDKLIALKPEHSNAFFQRARAYQQLNSYLKSEEDYERSIKLDNTNYKSYYNIKRSNNIYY